jgi:YD repeat-containing protein
LFPLSACNLAPVSPRVITQGQGLPTLHHLDWGFGAINYPVWSPDGKTLIVIRWAIISRIPSTSPAISPARGCSRNPVRVTVGSDLTTAPRYYYVYNGHGDVVALVDASGNTVASYSYDAFGQLTSASESFGSGTRGRTPTVTTGG